MANMSSDQLKALLEEQPDIAFAKVDGDGKHYTATIVSDVFVLCFPTLFKQTCIVVPLVVVVKS